MLYSPAQDISIKGSLRSGELETRPSHFLDICSSADNGIRGWCWGGVKVVGSSSAWSLGVYIKGKYRRMIWECNWWVRQLSGREARSNVHVLRNYLPMFQAHPSGLSSEERRADRDKAGVRIWHWGSREENQWTKDVNKVKARRKQRFCSLLLSPLDEELHVTNGFYE